MKKKLLLVCLVLALVLITACGENSAVSTIQPTELTEDEEDILLLVDGDTKPYVFDYHLKEEPSVIRIQLYQLEGDQWVEENFMSQEDPGKEGRIALSYQMMSERLMVGLLTDNVQETRAFTPLEEQPLEWEDTAYGGTTLSEPREFDMGEEVPLAIQLISSGSDSSMSIYEIQESFEDPTLYADQYEMVYLVTVTFE